MTARLFLVVPCYHEEEVLPETARQLGGKIAQLVAEGKIAADSRVLFVNDGSRDRTWEIICGLAEADPVFEGLTLSRNRGHQNALLAGLMLAKEHADVTVSLDADLQDDIGAIDQMVDKYNEGVDIVYGVRSDRTSDTFFKRFTAEAFYRLMSTLGVETVFNHADYRLMSRRALEGLAEFEESNLFLRGIIPMIGFRTDTVTYARGERLAGESKYPLSKMLALALNGVTSLSVRPIRFIAGLGLAVFAMSLLMALYVVVRLVTGHTVVGWASLAISVWALGGLMLLALGVVGEYVGKIYLETKRRPLYITAGSTLDRERCGELPVRADPMGER